MTDMQTQPQLEQRVALPSSEQLAILVTFQAGAKFGIEPIEIAKRYQEHARDEEAKLAWHAFKNEWQLGGTFATAVTVTGFFTQDVLRILNILEDLDPGVEAAIAYLSAVTPRKP